MALDLNTLKVRSISAAVFVIVLLSAVYLNYYTFFFFFFFVAMWALKEFYDLSEKLGVTVYRGIGMLGGFISFISVYARHFDEQFVQLPFLYLLQNLLYIVPFAIAIKFLFSETTQPFHSFVYSIAGIMYCILPFALLVQIPIQSTPEGITEQLATYNYFKVLGIILLIWSNDTFAYLGGSLFGKNKMYEKVSPGKTWEGTIIGVLLTIGVGFVLNINNTFSSPVLWPAIALFIGIFGTIGDLVESWMKRKAGVKDSGNIMPGHGGILDRFDSLLFVSPFLFVMIKSLEKFI
jgi:phosphatidate cytidylyltransferase